MADTAATEQRIHEDNLIAYLRQQRMAKGISIAQACKLTRYSHGRIMKIENNMLTQNVRWGVLVNYAKALGIKLGITVSEKQE